MIVLILIILCLATSCISTELLNAPEPNVVDTVVVKARPKPNKPQVDTTRVPIGFDVSVDDWDEINVDL